MMPGERNHGPTTDGGFMSQTRPADPASAPKYLRIAREIEAEILAGRPRTGKVPSSREVAGRFDVSAVTASRALQVLRDKGLIDTVGRSGSYLTSAPAPSSAPARARERYAVLLRSTPGPWQRASMSAPLAGFEAAGRANGCLIETGCFDPERTAGPAELRARVGAAVALGVGGVFFMPSRLSDDLARDDEAFVAACREAGLAIVLVERNLRGRTRPLESDLIAADDLDGGLRSAEHLLGLGRRRIAFVTGSPTSSHEGRIAGYLAAMFRARGGTGPAWEPLVLEQRADLPTKSSYEELADRALDLRADGVICYQDYTAVGLIMELLTRRLRVPEDLAITGFDNLPIGNSFALGVTTYEYPAEAVAVQAVRVMRDRLRDPSGPPVKVLVPGRLIVRESSALAP